MNTLIDFSSLIIQGINFAIVAFVLRKFFFVPYVKYLDEEARKRTELESKLAESEVLVKSAKDEASDIIEKAKVDAKMLASEIVDTAHKDAAEIAQRAARDAEVTRSKGFDDIAHERKALHTEMKTRVLDIALKLNAKLFSDPKAHKDFIEKNIAGVEL